jgi:uncharacterized protein (TIGR02231 family)
VTRREATVTFELPGKLDVPSDSQSHKYRVSAAALEAKSEYLSIPKLNPAVFLVARATLGGEVPLLPGSIQHFVGPDLVGSSWMAGRVPGEEFALSFGPEDRLKSVRKAIWRKVEQRGKDDETDLKFLTTLENHTGKEVSVTLKDRVPNSDDGRISVLLDERETTPGFARDAQEPGVLTWMVSLPQGGKKEVALRYRVRAPRGLALLGME